MSSAAGDNFSDSRHLRSLHPLSSLNDLTIPLLQSIEKQLKSDLQIVREVCCMLALQSWLVYMYVVLIHTLI